MRLVGLIFGALSATTFSVSAADLRKAPEEPLAPVAVSGDILFGSLEFDANALLSPSQKGLDAATAPYLSGVGKITYMPASRLIGVQGDVNLMGTSTDWIDPRSPSPASAYIYGGAAHVFTRAIPNLKIGAFISADWTMLSPSNFSSVTFPMVQGGLEGQYLVNPNFLVRARAGGGAIYPDSKVGAAPDGRIASFGIGATYAIDRAWTVGADLQYSRISGFGIPASLAMFDLTGFAEYRFSQSPLSVRGEVGWIRAQPKIAGAGVDLDGYRIRLGMKYVFGGSDSGRPRDLLDSEFRTHNFIAGLR